MEASIKKLVLYIIILLIATSSISYQIGYRDATPNQKEAIEVIGEIAFKAENYQTLHNTNSYVLIYVHKLNPNADSVWNMVQPVLWPN